MDCAGGKQNHASREFGCAPEGRYEEGRCRGPGRAVSGQRHLYGVESILEPTFHSVLIIPQVMQDFPFSFYRWEVQRDAAICSGSRKP